MGNTSTKYQSYQQYYEKNNIDGIDLNSLDPYKVLNVPKNFTWEQLKDGYKNAAIKTHPDKKGGNKIIFDFVTNCFTTLAEEYKARQTDKSHQDLKKDSKEYFDKILNNNTVHPSEVMLDINQPFEKRFNKIFDDCKYVDEDIEYGYGNIMSQSLKTREEINIDNVFDKEKVDNTTFNELFDKKVPVSKSIVKYKEPEPLLMAKQLQFTEIGSKRPDDYSSGVEKKSLAYTDYMKAHDGNRLADPNDRRKEFKSIKEYEKYRDGIIKKGLSDKEKKYIEKKRELEEQKEFERQERIRQHAILIQKAHEKANRLFLK